MPNDASAAPHTSTHDTDTECWSPARAEELYSVGAWGDGYFLVNDAGHVAAGLGEEKRIEVDLYRIVQQLRDDGHAFPVLIRLHDILHDRVRRLHASFGKAIADCGYQNHYRGVYPIKVNQLREVVEEILAAGAPFDFGLECGSRSELVAALAYLDPDDGFLLCNGYKDAGMMRLLLAAQKLGHDALPIIERRAEIDLLARLEDEMGVAARFGVRVRLTTRGAGLWAESGGEHSKFGLSVQDVVALAERLKREGRRDALQLLHFHLGSQIAALANVEDAVREAAQVYAWLAVQGFDVRYFDVGGGLGVTYEAGNSQSVGTIDYDLDAYTAAIIGVLKDVCDARGVPHPVVVSESGRAVTAHHSVLVVEAVDARVKDAGASAADAAIRHPLLGALQTLLDDVTSHEPVTPEAAWNAYRRAGALKDTMIDQFRRGTLAVEEKARFEALYWTTCRACYEHVGETDGAAFDDEAAALGAQLVDHYLCDFSVFRSMVDYWATGQRFPILPLHRLDEPPTRRGILVDLTCDSDGKVARFVSPEGDKRFLELHPLEPDRPYFLGLFLMGAYQDIMGDMHNLFGRVTEVHVFADVDEPDHYYVEELLPGATVEEQLGLVQYHRNDLDRRMNGLIQNAVKAGRIRPSEGVRLLDLYRRSFEAYTYLMVEGD